MYVSFHSATNMHVRHVGTKIVKASKKSQLKYPYLFLE